MKKLFLYIIPIALLFFNSCEDIPDNELFFKNEIVSIEYGTSFGECVGYCRNSIEITQTQIEFTSSSWNDDRYPDIVYKKTISAEEWEGLIEHVNFISFRNLEEVIGCPDCADGGAEWIKVVTADNSHKVTFEFRNEPKEVEELISELRGLIEEFDD